MGLRWFLLIACIGCCIIRASCQDHAEERDYSAAALSLIGSLLGVTPCLDERCSSSQSYVPDTDYEDLYEPQEPDTDVEYLPEVPKIHCILLRPSAVSTFADIERMHPGISDIKYRVMEELMHHMYPFATLALENCSPDMKLVDLIILAGNSLKTQYVLQGGNNCTYKLRDKVVSTPESHSKEQQPEKSTTSPGYGTTEGTKTPCPVTTEESVVSTQKPTTEKPCPEGSTVQQPYQKPTEKPTERPCPDGITTEQPCPGTPKVTEESYSSTPVEILAEDELEVPEPFVGSLRGIPGVHYPNYTEIPVTSFSCADKKYIPGFYADLETNCQVFHVCYEHRRESFLCPVGTIFNQPILACDYWYSSNCSLAPSHFVVNEKTEVQEEKIDSKVEEIISIIIANEAEGLQDTTKADPIDISKERDFDTIAQFLPVKAEVTELKSADKGKKGSTRKSETENIEKIASEIFDKIIISATKVASKTRDVVQTIPEPSAIKEKQVTKEKPVELPTLKVKPVKVKKLIAKSVPAAKIAAVKATVPLAVKAKIAAAIPAAKVAAVKATVPVAKAKLAVPAMVKGKAAAVVPVLVKGKVASVPKVAAKAFIPALKTKMMASAVPLAKTKILTPALKGKVLKGAGAPLVKAKMIGLPLAKSKLAGPLPIAKVKLAKAAAISPLTKKALALGYMKLLKAKKLALMG